MIYSLQSKYAKERGSSQKFSILLSLGYVLVCGLSSVYGIGSGTAYARTPIQNSGQALVQTSVTTTMSTTIPTPPSSTPYGNVATQSQTNSLNAMLPPLVIQNPATRTSYGQTPCAPSLERNIYLDSVWTSLVPRRQIYADPALKIHKSRRARVISVPKSANAPTNTNVINTATGQANNSNTANMPGMIGTPAGTTTGTAATTGNAGNAPLTPFVPSGTQNPEIPKVTGPVPTGLPTANTSVVEPNFGS